MPNAVAVLALLPVEPESSSAPILAKVPAPEPDASGSAIERAIGAAVAEAAIATCVAAELYGAGKSTLAATGRGAEAIAELHRLRKLVPEGFEAMARRAGKVQLRSILERNPAAVTLCQDRGLDDVLGELVDWPLGVLARVTADERLWAS